MLRMRFSHRVLLLPSLAAVSFLLLVFVHYTTTSTSFGSHTAQFWSTVVMIAISAVGVVALVALAAQVIASTSAPLARATGVADSRSPGAQSSLPSTGVSEGAPEELNELMTTLGRLVGYLRGVASVAGSAAPSSGQHATVSGGELRHALDRLVSAEAKQRQLVHSVQAIVWRMDPRSFAFTFVSRQAETLLGHPVARWTEESTFWRQQTHADDCEQTLAALALTVQERLDQEIEFRMRAADGRFVWLQAFVRVVVVGDDVKELVGVMVDVTERKRFEHALEQSTRRLGEAERLAHVGSWEWDLGSGLFTWSDEACRIFGVEGQAPRTSAQFFALVHPDDLPRVADLTEHRLHASTGHSLSIEHRVLRPDGGVRSVNCRANVQRDAAGKPVKVLGSIQDVTEIKDVMNALRDSEERYRTLFESNPHPMWVYERDTLRFLAVNDSAVLSYGYSREEFLEMTIEDIRPTEDRAALRASAKAASGVAHAGAWRHRTKDGSLLDVEITSHDVSFSGWPARLVQASDITERKRLEEQLRQSQKMEAIGRLAGGVAHDFNNLLNVIIGYAEILKRKLPADNAQRRNLEEILKASDRAATLTRQLLAFSRKQVLQPRDMDLNLIVSDMDKMLRRLIGEHIQLATSLGTNVGLVRADPGQIEQVIMNLAVNARDAMPAGGTLVIETAEVEVSASAAQTGAELEPGTYVLLSVGDTGHGMDPHTLSRIFEPFFTTKELGRGTGLGLSTVYGIVQQSGGHVNVSSTPGRGTSFNVYLPRVAAAGQPAHDVPAQTPVVRVAAETVLLVEDEGALREVVCEVLEDAGYTVIPASHGEDALAKVDAQLGTIDLLLTDVVMPGISGRQLAEQLHLARPGTRVLYMSGYTQDAIGHYGVLDAGTHFLPKPFTADALLQKVRAVLDVKV
jgi:two-component system cell cycle sensor histidine kinase/response regulator CckA